MLTCPHCGNEIRVRELPHQGWFENFRICPDCGGAFTVDTKTRRRQAFCLVLAVIALILTLMLHFEGASWLLPAVVSYAVLGLGIYLGNRRVRFVTYRKD